MLVFTQVVLVSALEIELYPQGGEWVKFSFKLWFWASKINGISFDYKEDERTRSLKDPHTPVMEHLDKKEGIPLTGWEKIMCFILYDDMSERLEKD